MVRISIKFIGICFLFACLNVWAQFHQTNFWRKLYPHSKSTIVNQADILFVIDNSFSTDSYHNNLDSRLSNFISQLTGIDYRIAVTTSGVLCNGGRYLLPVPPAYNNPPTAGDMVLTDIGGGNGSNCVFDPAYTAATTPNYYSVLGTNESYGRYIMDGLIMPLKNSPGFWITNTTPSAQLVLGDTIVETGVQGSWSEQSIKAVYRAVYRSQLNDINGYNINNINFFRPSASFIVIMLSDATESGILPDNQAVNLKNYVDSVWPQKNFHYHSIYNANWDQNPPCESLRGLLESCTLGQYTQITNLTNGIFWDIDNGNYTTPMSNMGAQVRAASRVVKLDCVPYSGVTVTGPGAIPTYTVAGNVVTFATNFTTPGSYTFNYRCRTP